MAKFGKSNKTPPPPLVDADWLTTFHFWTPIFATFRSIHHFQRSNFTTTPPMASDFAYFTDNKSEDGDAPFSHNTTI